MSMGSTYNIYSLGEQEYCSWKHIWEWQRTSFWFVQYQCWAEQFPFWKDLRRLGAIICKCLGSWMCLFWPVFLLLRVDTVEFGLEIALGLLSLDPDSGRVSSVLQSPPPLLDIRHLLATQTCLYFRYYYHFYWIRKRGSVEGNKHVLKIVCVLCCVAPFVLRTLLSSFTL